MSKKKEEAARQAAIQARNENRFMKDILFENEKIKKLFSKEELDELFNPYNYIGKAIEQTKNLIKILKEKYKL